ncbi:MAG: amidohydrolase [Mesorhizobium amorphae]|nr:MAG: amidohydrolase [Mesorhizobium amorphae]
MIIDTHLHLVDRTALTYPWLSDTPPLDRDWSLALYAEEAAALGITQALHMEVDVAAGDIERETAHVKELSPKGGVTLIGAIAACRPEDEGFAAYLEEVTADPFVRGLRRILHQSADDLSESALFRENIRRLEGHRLPFDLCVLPRQMPQVTALVDQAPGARFVLDHCGVPDIKAGALDPWRAGIKTMAERPNVVAKISGVIAYADGPNWTAETLKPFVHHVIECFGWDRLVWGSDWPVCTLGGGLTRWVNATHELVAGASEAEKAKLFRENAVRVWDLG